MNCRNFETIITELARGQMLEARVKEDALAHVEECQRCATRLADEQTLTAGLRTVAANMTTLESPARVEESLLLAFRQHRDAASSPAATYVPTKVMPRWMPWSIAAAAALLVVAALAVSHLLPTGSREAARQESNTTSPEQVSAPAMPMSVAKVSDESNGDAPDNVGQKPTNEITPSYAASRPRPAMRPAGLNSSAIHRDASYDVASGAREETATEFLPLTDGSDLAQLDGGQVVRIELSRSALQSLGLPMNVERAGDRVKADVLLGNDGVARAIRFVR